MVLRSERRRGVARGLMAALLDLARAQERSLLLLDVRAGDPAEALYQAVGFAKFGEVPRHAQSPDGSFAATSHSITSSCRPREAGGPTSIAPPARLSL